MTRNPHQSPIASGALALLAVAASVALLAAPASSAAAQPSGAEATASKAGKQRHGRKARSSAHRRKLRRLRRLNRTLRVSGNTAVARRRVVTADSSTSDVIDAGFEQGLMNWNTAGVGEVIPIVSGDLVRSGAGAGRFVLNGSEDRSELILGGDGGRSADDAVRFHEGDERWYSFSFFIESMTYGEPGAHNLIMQFKGDDEGSPYFGLQLWDYAGDDGKSGGRGLWSHGEGMDGDRFLSPVAERQWHDVVIHIKASNRGAGFYEVYLDGDLIDSASGVDTFPSYADHAYIKSGLYRNGSQIPGTSAIRLDAVRLGPSLSSVLPG